MASTREWDVTVGGRIENVTDVDTFPELFRTALAAEPGISTVKFISPTWPHTTAVVIRITANQKKDAEQAAQEMMLPIFRRVASAILAGQPFGWVLSVDAVPASATDV